MTTLDIAIKDAKLVADISKKYAKFPVFQGLVAEFSKGKSPKPINTKKAAKPQKRKASAPKQTRAKKGEWPVKIAAVLQEMGAASAADIITALGYEKDKAKSAHVRTVLSSLKKTGKVENIDGKYSLNTLTPAPVDTLGGTTTEVQA